MKDNLSSSTHDGGNRLQQNKSSLDRNSLENAMTQQSPAQLQSEGSASSAPTPAAKPVNNTGLPDNIKSGVERLSGYSMDDVKVHYNSSKPAQLQAHAYAQGTDIHVAPGQEQHVAHEAWHVVQQKQGRVQPTKQLKGKVNVNDNAGLEHEADVMGAKAAQLDIAAASQLKTDQLPNRVAQKKSVVQCNTGRTITGKKEFVNYMKGAKKNDPAAYKAAKNRYGTYDDYKERFDKNERSFEKSIARSNNVVTAGQVLYHSTGKNVYELIRQSGILPKKIQWGGPDASKDGVVSFATVQAGAASLESNSVMLRVRLTNDHIQGKYWWEAGGGTELRTTQEFLPKYIEVKNPDDNTWKKIKEVPPEKL